MKSTEHIVNISLQVIPISREKDPYHLVDTAIQEIRTSGVKHIVCPMETVMEGQYDELMSVIKNAQQAVIEHGAQKVIAHIKIEWAADQDISMESKTGKWQPV